jgi:membrane-associated phospholipid phosphatase
MKTKVIFFTLLSFSLTAMLIKFIDTPLSSYMLSLDREIYLLFDSFTDIGKSHWWLLGGLLTYFIWREWSLVISKSGIFLFWSVALSGIFVNISKIIFGRVRPYHHFKSGEDGFHFWQFDSSFASFPSGHSATALSVTMVFSLLFPKYRFYILGAGVVLAFSRVVTLKHYLSDIFMGSLIGVVTVLILYYNGYSEFLNSGKINEKKR